MDIWTFVILVIQVFFLTGYFIKFAEHIRKKNEKPPRSVVIPLGNASVKAHAFRFCKTLESVDFPETLRHIETGAFYGCKNLQVLAFPEGLETIENSAFFQCTSLQSVQIPGSVRMLAENCFGHCSSLETVQLSEGLTYIGRAAFCGCKLKQLTIPESVQYIGVKAFALCKDAVFDLSVKIPEIAECAFSAGQSLHFCRNGRHVYIRLLHDWDSAPEDAALIQFLQSPQAKTFAAIEPEAYQTPAALLFYDTDEEIRKYLQGVFNCGLGEALIREQNMQLLSILMQDGFITAEHIDNLIEFAIEQAQNGGSFEIQAMLMDYKAKHFEFRSIAERLHL